MLQDIVKCFRKTVDSTIAVRLPTGYNISIIQIYRLCAHAVLAGIASFISFQISRQHDGSSTIYGVIFIFVVAMFTVSYFISLHGDIAEGILISIFVEEKLSYLRDNKRDIEKPVERVI